MAKAQATTTKRGPGRPPSFPGQATKAFLSTIPEDTIGKLHEVAEKRGVNINIALDALIRRGHKDATRKRSKKS